MELAVDERVQSRISACPGPRAAEAYLLRRLGEWLSAARGEPGLLARPVAVVVSSDALRDQLSARIVEALGPAVVGVVVQTLRAAAWRVVERETVDLVEDTGLWAIVARREAAREPLLAEVLASFEDGYATVLPSVRDFIGAGINAETLAAVERMAGEQDDPAALRAAAVARVAWRTVETLASHGVDVPGAVLRRAAELLGAGGDAALPWRSVLIHGFADANGQAVALLAALLRHGAELVLDLPPDPRDVSRRDPGARFCDQLLRRLAPDGRDRVGQTVVREMVSAEVSNEAAPEPSVVPRSPRQLCATGLYAEVDEVARQIRQLAARGVAWESIGVVARDLSAYAVPLRRRLDHWAVPYRALETPQSLLPAHRRWLAVRELILRGIAAPVDAWIDGCSQDVSSLAPAVAGEDLRLAFRAIGTISVAEAMVLDPTLLLDGRASYPLPLREGVSSAASQGDDGAAEAQFAADGAAAADDDSVGRRQARRRCVPASVLRQAIGELFRLGELLQGWGEAPLSVHVERLRRLLGVHLGWESTSDRRGPAGPGGTWQHILAELESAGAAGIAFSRQELVLLLDRRPLVAVAPAPSGGGVWILDAMHARGLTFEHLFAIGLNRGVFPRTVQLDAVLPDHVRTSLRAVLPDLAVKEAGHDEERYLFAQLMAAAPAVTLSWASCDDAGRAQSPSPLLRVWGGDTCAAAEIVDTVPRCSDDLLREAALGHNMAAVAALLPVYFEEVAGELSVEAASGWPSAADLARAQLDSWSERVPDPTTVEGRLRWRELGPYLGLIGAGAWADDPVYVTTLESLARCPWQTFLRRALHLEPAPDPWAELPGLTPLMVGTTVHAALETLLGAGGPLQRPAPDVVREAVQLAAAKVAHGEGLRLPGLIAALAVVALPPVERALALDWRDAEAVEVVGVEVEGALTLEDEDGRVRRIAFRADRVDLVGERRRLTDYKTGRPIATVARADTRARKLAEALRRGERLQVAAYAASGGPGGAIGRYLFVDPALSDDHAQWLLDGSDPLVTDELPRIVRELLALRDGGVMAPRLEDSKGEVSRACAYCDVAEACVRGDSLARARLRRVVEHGRVARAEASASSARISAGARERQLLARLWTLDGGSERS